MRYETTMTERAARFLERCGAALTGLSRRAWSPVADAVQAITHTLQWSYSTPGRTSSQSLSASNEGEDNRDIVVAANATNYQVAYALTVAKCQGFFMVADAAMTVKTNSTSAPDQTFTLAAGVPVAWMTGAGACPVTVNVTTLYITSVPGGNLTILTLIDAT